MLGSWSFSGAWSLVLGAFLHRHVFPLPKPEVASKFSKDFGNAFDFAHQKPCSGRGPHSRAASGL